MDSEAYSLISATATNIANLRIDLRIARLGIFVQQSKSRHQHSALAVTALGNLMLDPRQLQRMELGGAESLDCGHGTTSDTLQRSYAGALRAAIYHHGACTASPDPATEFGSG